MSKERILLVEDNAMDRSILSRRLQAEGYDVVGVINGSDAIRAAWSQDPALMILDLTLMDEDRLNTPLWDGFSLLEWMRRIMPGMNIPVIIHTGAAYSSIAAQARASGVSLVFEKVEDINEVLQAVRQVLDEKKERNPVSN